MSLCWSSGGSVLRCNGLSLEISEDSMKPAEGSEARYLVTIEGFDGSQLYNAPAGLSKKPCRVDKNPEQLPAPIVLQLAGTG